MKKLFVLSAFALLASASLTNTKAQVKPGNGGGHITLNNGCYYVTTHHSILFGLIQWDSEPELIGCGSGFA